MTVPVVALALYLTLLGISVSVAQDSNSETAPESDLDRLRGLLQRHQGADTAEIVEASPALDPLLATDLESKESDFAARLNADYSPEKVLLRADELSLLLADVEARLADTKTLDRRSDASLIGTIQIRHAGSLVGSSRYSLTHIGKHQFVGHTDFAQGRNILGVADVRWEIELPTLEGRERYLLLLVAPPREDWKLHALPASATTQLGDDRPHWLQESPDEASPTL